MVNNRRSELEIISKILHLSKNGAKKTEILYQGNLSYSQLTSYLSYLVDNNILEVHEIYDNGNSGKKYKLTEKGNSLLIDINKTLSYFRE